MKITPNHLQVLLHYYIYCNEHEGLNASAIKKVIKDLGSAGMLAAIPQHGLDIKNTSYKVTEKGRAWIEAILKVPMPVCKWVIEQQELL